MDLIGLVGPIRRVISLVARPLPAQDKTNTEDTQTSMPLVEFEPTIRMFERVKTFHGLDRAVTVIGALILNSLKVYQSASERCITSSS
jgi:hypothetical protein